MSAKELMAAELGAQVATVQVSDFVWKAGESIRYLESDFIVGYRPYPEQVTVSAQMNNGSLQQFGQLMFFPAEVEVNTNPADINERVRNIRCRFDAEWFRSFWGKAPLWEPESLRRCYDMRNLRIEQIIQRMGQEAQNPGFASELMIDSLSTMIAIEIVRHFDSSCGGSRVRTREGKLSKSDLSRILEYIDSCEDHCPSVSEIAQVCDISPAHLRRTFKKTTGATVHDYVERIRLRKAQDLLVNTDLPLKIISHRLGFANSSTFSSTFRRASMETPSDYRHRRRTCH